MLYSMQAINKVTLMSSDGAHGEIKDIYFDDATWTVRYFVIDMGTWLSDRIVLISTEAISRYSEVHNAFPTELNRQHMVDSPPFHSEKTVSRAHEERLSQYYGWSPYWAAPMTIYPWAGFDPQRPYPAGSIDLDKLKPDPVAPAVDKEIQVQNGREQAQHLRSFNEVKTYGLRARDGDIGEMDDLLIEPETWQITHVIADARKWWPGGQVVIDRSLVEDIIWNERKIVVGMTRDEVKNAPSYDRNTGVTESFQSQLTQYYAGFKDRALGMRHSVSASTHSQPPV